MQKYVRLGDKLPLTLHEYVPAAYSSKQDDKFISLCC